MKSISLNKEMQKIITDIGNVAQYSWARGWAEKNAGNISVDITDFIEKRGQEFNDFEKISMPIPEPVCAARCFMVTTAGSRFCDLAREPEKYLLIIHITQELDGYHILWSQEGVDVVPTSEMVSHLKIQGFLSEHNKAGRAILHTHPTYLIALSHIEQYSDQNAINELLWSMHPEMKMLLPEGIGLVPYQYPGSEALADATLDILSEHRVALWVKHGCLAIGDDLIEAFDLIDIAEKAAKIFFICKSAGFEAQGLTPEQLEELEEQYRIENEP